VLLGDLPEPGRPDVSDPIGSGSASADFPSDVPANSDETFRPLEEVLEVSTTTRRAAAGEPSAWWRMDGNGYLFPRDLVPDEPLSRTAGSAVQALGRLVSSPLSVVEYVEDSTAATVNLVARDDSSGDTWRVAVEWSEGNDGRSELLEALSALFGEPAPIVGLRRLRSRNDVRAGVVQTPSLHLLASSGGIPEPEWDRLLDSVAPGTCLELSEDDGSYRAVRIGSIAVACYVDAEGSIERVDDWIRELMAAARPG
jgi:hypothetical protein